MTSAASIGEICDHHMAIRIYRTPGGLRRNLDGYVSLYHGDSRELVRSLPDECMDVIITSPPYCIGKDYETSKSVSDFLEFHSKFLPEIARVTKSGGSVCWQVGFHPNHGNLTPLDYLVFSIFSKIKELKLRNRIIWSYEHGLHRQRSFSGRYEVILWYTKGDNYSFDLDAVRVPQKYPGKRSYKGPNKGQFSGNPLGKNPGDVWSDIPNVKGRHVEKTKHPCQFPVSLPIRLIRALTKPGDLVFDPFMGVGSTGMAAVADKRRFVGAELNKGYVEIARERIMAAARGEDVFRPLERPILRPSANMAVARKPAHFKI